MAFSDRNRTLKKIHEAVQRPTTGHWFLLDYSLPHYQIGSWAIVFPSSFMINFRTVYIWYIYQSLDKRIWFAILFQENLQWLILSQLELPRTELPKSTSTILMEMWQYHFSCFINCFLYDPACKPWFFERFIFELEASYSIKVTCILVRQVILLRKLVVSSAKFIVYFHGPLFALLKSFYQH